jgi:hypothetical protein
MKPGSGIAIITRSHIITNIRLMIGSYFITNGHLMISRKNNMNAAYKFTGVSLGSHARYGAMCVVDFAAGYVEK